MVRELPRGWTLSTIGEIVKFNPKNTVEDNTDAGFIPMSHVPIKYGEPVKVEQKKWGNIKKGYTHFQNDDVILAKITPCFENGKAAIIEGLPSGIGSGSTEFFVFRAIDKLYHPKLLLAFVKQLGFLKNGAAVMTGSVGHRRVPKNYVLEHPIPVPPFPEQKQIVDKLDCLLAKVDACKARLEKVPEIIKRFRQSVLADATSGRLTEDWREKNSETENSNELLKRISEKRNSWIKAVTKQDNKEAKRASAKLKKHSPKYPTNKLPNSWKWASLLEASCLVVDCHNKTAPYTDDGIPLVRTSNIRDGKMVLDKMKYINEDTYEYWSRRCPPEKGDLFFTREAPMGEAMIVPKGQKLCMGQRMMLLRPFSDLLDNNYLLYCLLDPNFKSRMLENAIGTGVKHLRVGDVENLCIPIAPYHEQMEIVKRVESFFSIADQMEEKLKRAQNGVDKLTTSILAKAFRGELVLHDPSDETAEKLLEHNYTDKKSL